MAPSLRSSHDFLHLRHNERRQIDTSTTTANGGLSGGAKAGIALGVIIPVILASLILFYLYRHNWTVPERWRQWIQRPQISQSRPKMPGWRPKMPQWKPKLPQWRPQMSGRPRSSADSMPWHRIASVTRQASTILGSSHSSSSKTDVTLTERDRPPTGKFWSPDEVGPDGEKANTGRSRFSVVAPAEPYEPKVVKAPRPPSIFTSKTSIYGVERNGEPEVVRPSSKQVKTWSRHISAQFGDWGKLPTRRVSEESPVANRGEEAAVGGGKVDDTPPVPRPNKRDSKSVITNLDWMEYDPGR